MVKKLQLRYIGDYNERGKGDHRHIGKTETRSVFVDEERLLADFWQNVMEAANEK